MIQRLPFTVTPAMQRENEAHGGFAPHWTTEVLKARYPTRADFCREYAASAEARQLDEVLKLVKPGARVLDIGAGFGVVAVYLASRGYQVSVAEPSLDLCEYIERAGRLYDLPLTIYHVSGEALDELPGKTFDACAFHASLHHCDDPVRALTNCASLLAPGGKLFLLSEPLLQRFRSKRWFERKLARGELIAGDYGGNEHIYYYHEYRAMLKQAGFERVTDLPSFRYRDPKSYLKLLEHEKAPRLSLVLRKMYYATVARLLRLGPCGRPMVALLKRLSLVQTDFVATCRPRAA